MQFFTILYNVCIWMRQWSTCVLFPICRFCGFSSWVVRNTVLFHFCGVWDLKWVKRGTHRLLHVRHSMCDGWGWGNGRWWVPTNTFTLHPFASNKGFAVAYANCDLSCSWILKNPFLLSLTNYIDQMLLQCIVQAIWVSSLILPVAKCKHSSFPPPPPS